MNSAKRLNYILIALLALLFVGLIGGAYGTNKLLASEANKLTTLKAKDQALAQEQTSFSKAQKDIKKYADLHKITQAVVPEDKNQAEAVREIVNIAAAHGVVLAAVTFPASTLGTTATGTTATATPASAAPVASNSKAGSLSQLTPLKSIVGVYQLPITVQGDSKHPVPYDKFVSFLSDIEHNRRTSQVSSITITPDQNNANNLTFTLVLNEYIKP